MAGPLTLTIGEDTVIEVRDLTDDITDDPITDATLEMAVLDSSGAAVAENLPLSFVSGSTYRGTVPGTLSLSSVCKYTVLITGETGDGLPIYRPHEAVARYA